jgi:hypothetical protein
MFLHSGYKFFVPPEALGFLPVIFWEAYFFNASGSYKPRPIYLDPELELNSRLPDRTLLLRIFHPEENFTFISFQIVEGHVITYDLMWIMLL